MAGVLMKKLFSVFLAGLLALSLTGCGEKQEYSQIAATTLPVAEFTARLCRGTDLTVSRLVTEPVSCLHDYSLNVRQVRAAEAAETIVISGGGLEGFLDGVIDENKVIDSSAGIALLEGEEHHHEAEHQGEHHHEEDPHFWLDPDNAMVMAENICDGLCLRYPEHRETFRENLAPLLEELTALKQYGEESLKDLSCRELITFHDGFSYFAAAYDLEILAAVEEESGSEASARELIGLIRLVQDRGLPAIFTEANGSASAADIISRETGAAVFSLDMAMSGESYFTAMYHNMDTIKEALG